MVDPIEIRSIVILRGLGREAGHWHEFPDLLARALPGAGVETPDLPGTGALLGVSSPLSVRGILDVCRSRFLSGRGRQNGRFCVLGVSLGGMVALEWASRFPAEVAGVVLVNSSDLRSGRLHERLRPGVLRHLLRIATAQGPHEMEERVLDMTTNLVRGERRARILAERTEAARSRPVSAATNLRQIVAAATYRGPARLEAPALVLASHADGMVSPACSKRLARRLGASLVTVEDAGHDLTTDEPEACARAVREWLAIPIRREASPR